MVFTDSRFRFAAQADQENTVRRQLLTHFTAFIISVMADYWRAAGPSHEKVMKITHSNRDSKKMQPTR